MKRVYLVIALVFTVGLGLGLSVHVFGEEASIPSWIKNTAKFWVDGQIGDQEFIQALQYLINKGILTVEETKTEDIFEKINSQFNATGSEDLEKLFPTSNDIDRYWKPEQVLKNWFPTHKLEEGFVVSLKLNYNYYGDDILIDGNHMFFEITKFDSVENAKFAFDLQSRSLADPEWNHFKEFNVKELGFDENQCSLFRRADLGNTEESSLYKFNFVCYKANLLIESSIDDQIHDAPHTEFLKAMKSVLGKI